MNLFNLKPGDEIKVYNCGSLVTGIVKSVGEYWVKVKTEPIKWGNEIFDEVSIGRPTELQYNYGGNNAVPGCFYNGQRITT